MNLRLRLASVGLLLVAACAGSAEVRVAQLEARPGWTDAASLALWSFAEGAQEPQPGQPPEGVDLMLYYDGDDCAGGALLGPEERIGFLYPIGPAKWTELKKLDPPDAAAKSVVAIHPLAEIRPGFAFWVRVGAGEFVIARFRDVPRADLTDRSDDDQPLATLEWWRPPDFQAALREDPGFTLDARPSLEPHCGVHDRACLEDWVEIDYGLVRPPSPAAWELQRNFPNVNHRYLGGCVPRSQERALVYACPDCRAEYFAALEELPKSERG